MGWRSCTYAVSFIDKNIWSEIVWNALKTLTVHTAVGATYYASSKFNTSRRFRCALANCFTTHGSKWHKQGASVSDFFRHSLLYAAETWGACDYGSFIFRCFCPTFTQDSRLLFIFVPSLQGVLIFIRYNSVVWSTKFHFNSDFVRSIDGSAFLRPMSKEPFGVDVSCIARALEG